MCEQLSISSVAWEHLSCIPSPQEDLHLSSSSPQLQGPGLLRVRAARRSHLWLWLWTQWRWRRTQAVQR